MAIRNLQGSGANTTWLTLQQEAATHPQQHWSCLQPQPLDKTTAVSHATVCLMCRSLPEHCKLGSAANKAHTGQPGSALGHLACWLWQPT
jgi:hypothetical protein